MDRAIQAWLRELHPGNEPTALSTSPLKLTYTLYGCMLLLSHNSFECPAWQEVQRQLLQNDLERLYAIISQHLKVTHIAINKPIPALNNDGPSENKVRSPENFTPLYGDFGPSSSSYPPNAEDFKAAFWVTAKQNGIFQTWAPRWTMFSRGNISEKARLLQLPSVGEAVEQGKSDGTGSAAVDLYAGIGYFAFSYLKAGVDNVLCWDLNPWSIEGLRRGAAANKWSTAFYTDDDVSLEHLIKSGSRLLVFNESNEHALSRIRQLPHSFPPFRHVNCGLLPTSRGSWQTAVKILDREMGGWVHVHENFATNEIDFKAEEVRLVFQRMLEKDARGGIVEVDHINRLKSYAPGVMHCVLDIYVPPYAIR